MNAAESFEACVMSESGPHMSMEAAFSFPLRFWGVAVEAERSTLQRTLPNCCLSM